MIKRLLTISVFLLSALSGAQAMAAEFCGDEYYINQTLPNGSKWDMCWTYDANQGVRYHHVFFQAPDQERRMVLYDASIAEIHVPYDDNGARYHDVSDFGLGGDNLLNIAASECVGGTRAYHNGQATLCKQILKDGSAYRSSDNRDDLHYMKLFSVSKVGEYIYMPEWTFYSDGRMQPRMVATGALQRFGTSGNEQHGWLMANNKIGLSHMHNFFWRLDFDLDGTGDNDVFQELNYGASGGKRYATVNQFTTETARSVNPQTMRSWLVKDGNTTNSKGHAIAYEIRLSEAGQREVGPDYEPFTHNDIYLTKAHDCERIASHNTRIFSCDTDNLSEYVNGESLEGQDLVSWVAVSFYHMPRSEDAPQMDAHVSKFDLIPRDWHATNPVLDYTPPVELRLTAVDDYATTYESTSVDIAVMSNDTGSGLYLNTLDNPANGTSANVNNKIRYTPDAGFTGTDVFWYSIKDSSGNVYGAKIHVTVNAGSDPGTGGGSGGNNGSVSSGGGGAMSIPVLLLMLLGSVLVISSRTRRRLSVLSIQQRSQR